MLLNIILFQRALEFLSKINPALLHSAPHCKKNKKIFIRSDTQILSESNGFDRSGRTLVSECRHSSNRTWQWLYFNRLFAHDCSLVHWVVHLHSLCSWCFGGIRNGRESESQGELLFLSNLSAQSDTNFKIGLRKHSHWETVKMTLEHLQKAFWRRLKPGWHFLAAKVKDVFTRYNELIGILTTWHFFQSD